MDYQRQARHFIENEKEFHLGFLQTEQSSPLTRGLDRIFGSSTAEGVKTLQKVDRNVLKTAERVFNGDAYGTMVAAGVKALADGKRIVFSGCGATGRLSILLEAMWRRYFLDHPGPSADRFGNSVFSIMTGGDYALIRSVEFFEDYQEFGRQQVRELGMSRGDVLIAITEGGETSSVLGTAEEAARRQADVFLMFNNPAELLREKLERCRHVIDNPAVTVIDLSCGPMAIAGSTRMQATTSEQLVAGAALEEILRRITGLPREGLDFSDAFEGLLTQLEAPEAVSAVAGYIDWETDLYGGKGLVTYFADGFLLDILTDTTERSPTFMLPPFGKSDDVAAPQSWAFVKNPLLPTRSAWNRCLARQPRCLRWTAEDYRSMGADRRIIENPPKLDRNELMKFTIGNEDSPARHRATPHAAVLIGEGDDLENAFARQAAHYRQHKRLTVPFVPASSPLQLMKHLGLKLVMNTVSTGTMVKMGRVSGNWMSWVDVSNKKLIDRAIRLIAELRGMRYEDACQELFKAVDELGSLPAGAERMSPVQHVLRKL